MTTEGEKTIGRIMEECLSQFTTNEAARLGWPDSKWQVVQLLIGARAYCGTKGLDWSEISLLADQGWEALLASLAEIPHVG